MLRWEGDMMDLTTAPNIPDPDGFYAELLQIHDGCSPEETHTINARLVLILANHIGNRDVLQQALEAAKKRRG